MGILAPWTANPQTLSQRSAAEEVKGLTLRLPAAGAPSSGISWVMAKKAHEEPAAAQAAIGSRPERGQHSTVPGGSDKET